MFTCPGEMYWTAALFQFTVTLVPSRLVGNTPFTISAAGFHSLESPGGARLAPNTATQEPGARGFPFTKPAALTIAEITGPVPTERVALTTGLGETPFALNVIRQE